MHFSAPGVTPSLPGLTTNVITLAAGGTWLVQPAGWYEVKPGKFTAIQEYDPIAQFWRTIGAGSVGASLERLYSDGNNYRLANQSGCVVGALLTTAGSGYSAATPPTFSAGAGGALFRCIVGGAINTSVTVSNGGTNYVYPPTVLFAPPPPGGIQATGYATISAGAVTTVTVTDQGAGYTSPPVVSFVNDPREGQNGLGTGVNAAAVTTLTGAGTVTGVICIDHGTPVTSVPTLTASSGAVAATAIMCWTVTAYTISATTAGSGYVAPVLVSGYGGFPGTSPAYTNPTTQSNLVKTRPALILAALSTGAITATGQTIYDGGVYAGAPTMYVQSSNVPGAGAVAAVFLTPTMGGVSDTSIVLST
jgi:hypothetical protein